MSDNRRFSVGCPAKIFFMMNKKLAAELSVEKTLSV